MPWAPKRPCMDQKCPNFAIGNTGRCALHQRDESLYQTPRWKVRRREFLRSHRLCECGHTATEVDHLIPHKGDERIFFDERNWVGRCKSCHSSKTATRDGGFGNARRL